MSLRRVSPRKVLAQLMVLSENLVAGLREPKNVAYEI